MIHTELFNMELKSFSAPRKPVFMIMKEINKASLKTLMQQSFKEIFFSFL